MHYNLRFTLPMPLPESGRNAAAFQGQLAPHGRRIATLLSLASLVLSACDRRTLRHLLPASLILLGGCDLFGPKDDWPVEFRIVGFLEPGETTETWNLYFGPPDVDAAGGNREILVDGDFLLPCTNYHPYAEATREGNKLTLRIDYRREKICDNSTVKYVYVARLRTLEPNTYTLTVQQRLWHFKQGGEGILPVLDQQVEVR
jgi:hypothetical protein